MSEGRILMTADAVGGVWTYATRLAEGLAGIGFEVNLVTLGPRPRPDQLKAVQHVDGVQVITTDFALEWMDPEGADFAHACERLGELGRQLRPDLVHINGFREALADWQVPVLVTGHSCVRSWWQACRGGEPDEPRWSTYVSNVAAGLAAADRWVAPTAWFRDELQNLYAPPTSGHVIRNGIATDVQITPKEPFILAAGRLWDEAKNLRMLTAAANDAPWPVRIAGSKALDGGGFAAPGQAEMLGELRRPEMLATMQRAAVFAAPSLYEPFGLAVLEAAAAGCALVLADIPSFRELWAGAALFADPRDQGAFDDALRSICEDTVLRRRLQVAALRRAHRYSLASMVSAYASVYRTMIACPARAPSSSRDFLLEASA